MTRSVKRDDIKYSLCLIWNRELNFELPSLKSAKTMGLLDICRRAFLLFYFYFKKKTTQKTQLFPPTLAGFQSKRRLCRHGVISHPLSLAYLCTPQPLSQQSCPLGRHRNPVPGGFMMQVAGPGRLECSSVGRGCPVSHRQMHMAARSLQTSQRGDLQLELTTSHKTPTHQKSTFIHAGAPGATLPLSHSWFKLAWANF